MGESIRVFAGQSKLAAHYLALDHPLPEILETFPADPVIKVAVGVLPGLANHSATSVGMSCHFSDFAAQTSSAHPGDLPGDPESFWPQIATGRNGGFQLSAT